MINSLDKYVMMIHDDNLRDGIYDYISYHEEDLAKCPASIKHHHSYEGGLVVHIVECLEIALALIDNMRKQGILVNEDAIIASLLIHDMGKPVIEYYYNKSMKIWTYRSKEIRMSHSQWVPLDYAEVIGKPLPYQVAVCVLAHMGGWERTGVEADTIEAAIVHASDLVSSRMEKNGGGSILNVSKVS